MALDTIELRLRRLEEERREHEQALDKLSDRIDKLTIAVVGFALTLAVFGLGIAVTLLTTNTGG